MISPVIPLILALGLALAGWQFSLARARTWRPERDARRMAALPGDHAWYVALWIAIPAGLFAVIWGALVPALAIQRALTSPAAAGLPAFGLQRQTALGEALAVASGKAPGVFHPAARPMVAPLHEALSFYSLIGLGLTALIALAAGAYAFSRIGPRFGSRTRVERVVMGVLLVASLVAIATTIGIFGSLLFETVRFFGIVSPVDFLFGTHWAPDPMATPGPDIGRSYGALPLFWGTIFIGAIIAMLVAIPLGLMSAIYLTQYAPRSLRAWMKPVLEILAGVPTVVYGYFAALTVAPLVRDFGQAIGIGSASSESALAAGLVMGVMIIPLVSSLADDSLGAVPQAMRDGSLALGATHSETIRKVLIPAALPGIVAGVMLAVSRAIGETMIVVMAAGATANLSANPFASMTTVTYQIVAMLTGEASFDHPATLAAFALGMLLFLITLFLNFVALRVVKRFREAYE